jgi:hypothetical protein
VGSGSGFGETEGVDDPDFLMKKKKNKKIKEERMKKDETVLTPFFFKSGLRYRCRKLHFLIWFLIFIVGLWYVKDK